MRYIECVLIPTDGGLHPAEERLANDPEVELELLYDINLLSDDTLVTLYELSGDEARVEEILDASPEICSYNLSHTGDSIYAYIHVESNETVSELLTILDEFEFVTDTPFVYTQRGGLKVTLVGKQETIREAIPAVPDNIRVKLEQMGTYAPSTDRLFSRLTTRQQETLLKAVELGYYDVPRQATHRDIARELDKSGGTVGEHLRKIEAQVLSQIVP